MTSNKVRNFVVWLFWPGTAILELTLFSLIRLARQSYSKEWESKPSLIKEHIYPVLISLLCLFLTSGAASGLTTIRAYLVLLMWPIGLVILYPSILLFIESHHVSRMYVYAILLGHLLGLLFFTSGLYFTAGGILIGLALVKAILISRSSYSETH